MTTDPPRKLAVVTGASSGIGEATALALVAQGWRVVLVARGKEALDAVAARAADMPGETIVEALDAADGDAVTAMAARVSEQYGVPELIVNSAGAGEWRFIEETSPADAVRMMNAPYFAAFNTTHAFMAGMLERRSGLVIHVGSPASSMAWPGATGYIAARWALRGLHEALVQDLRGTGVRSSHVVFGEVSSAYFDNNPETHERVPTIGKLIPVSTPERCAKVLLRVARRPRSSVYYPFMLRMFYLTSLVVPWLVRWLAGTTGVSHSK